MPRINFQQQLVALKDKLLAMAALSQQALEFSIEAYTNRDLSLAQHVRDIEKAINSAETSVDEMAYDLLAKEQPMAIDLRFILSVIKINGDLERIGDQATNIASRTPANTAAGTTENDAPCHPADIKTMGAKVGVMIRRAIQAPASSRSTASSSAAISSASATTPPTSPKTSSSGSAATTSATSSR